MTIEIVDFPINSMVIFNSYVKLPEGTHLKGLSMFIPDDDRDRHDAMTLRISGERGPWLGETPHRHAEPDEEVGRVVDQTG